MDDANLDTGAETTTDDGPLAGDELANRMAELLNDGDESDESIDKEVIDGDDEDQSDDDKPEADKEPLYTVKVDGQEIQVKQSELLAGYQRDVDYRNKTKAVSAEKQQIEAERQSVVQERNTALQLIERFQSELGQMQPDVDWTALLESDPQEYLKQQHMFQQRQAQYNQAEQAKRYMQSQQAQEQQAHLQNYLKAETEALQKAIPDFADPVKAAKTGSAIKEYLKGQNFSDADITSVADHRMLVIADKARKFDDLMAKASLTTKKVQKLPTRVERPGSAEPRSNGRAEALRRLDRSGSIQDAAAAFEKLL